MLDGPVGLVGAGYIGHLFAQQFALAGREVRVWSPGRSAGTLHDRLRQSVSTLAEISAVPPSEVDAVLDRVSVHDDLAAALAPCAAVMESVVEDADIKSACYRDIEAIIGDESHCGDCTWWTSVPLTRSSSTRSSRPRYVPSFRCSDHSR